MTRSVWKGPLSTPREISEKGGNGAVVRAPGTRLPSRPGRAARLIMPQFVGLTFGVHNGQKHVPVLI